MSELAVTVTSAIVTGEVTDDAVDVIDGDVVTASDAATVASEVAVTMATWSLASAAVREDCFGRWRAEAGSVDEEGVLKASLDVRAAETAAEVASNLEGRRREECRTRGKDAPALRDSKGVKRREGRGSTNEGTA